MTAPAVNEDSMLQRARRLGALTARLPALPVHDWLDRVALILGEVIPGATVLALLASHAGCIERIGAAGPDADLMNRDPKTLMRRLERLPPMPHELTVDAPPQHLTTRLGGRFGVEQCLMAAAPLGGAESRRLVVVVAGGCEAEPVLRLAMPDLVLRALAALGPAPSESNQWLLPADTPLLEGLIAGKTIQEIARDVDRKEHAVQDAIKTMYRRLGRNRRTVLVARAVGYVPASEIEGKGDDGCSMGAEG
jgi:hypothetical protein